MANILNVKQSVLDALKTIGLNLYERRLWVSLLQKGNSTAGELADMSNVPRSRCYDVLESLADKGFVIIQPAKPMRYVAIKPKEALERAKNRLIQKTNDMTKRIERMKTSEVVRDLEKIYGETVKIVKPEDFSGALRGRDALLEQLGSIMSNAKKSINFITTEQGLQEIYEKHGKTLQKAAKSGVKIKIAAPINKRTEDVAQELLKIAEIKNIENIKYAEKIPSRCFSIDGQHFIMSLTNDSKTKPNEDLAFWAQSDHAASDFFEPMFRMVWEHGKDVC